jgi:DNA-binding NarL/FixJ family response regulator
MEERNLSSLTFATTTPAPTPRLPRVLFADDHQLILDALGAIMKDDFDVLAVDSCQTFLNAVENFRPDIAVLDVSMPGGDGFSTARKVLQKQPSLPIVFLSMYGEPTYVQQAVQVGAKAYLSKRAPAQELMSALHSVLDGNTLLPERTLSSDMSSELSPMRSELTARQKEVLKLIASGCSAKDIANQLNISVRTAEFHRAAIMQRLDLHSTAQMTRYALVNSLA